VLRMALAIGLLIYGAGQSLRGPYYALLFYLWFAYFRPEKWVWGDALQGLNLSFYIGIWAVGSMLFSAREKFARDWSVVLILLFLAHGLVSTFVSPYFEWSIVWWEGFAKVAVITVLIISLVNTLDRFKLTLLVIVFSLGLESVKQGWYHLLLNPGERNLNEVEILGDNNGVAVGMLMLSALLLGLFQTAARKSHKFGYGFALLGCVFRALSTFSRGGMLAFGAMLAVYWSRSKHKVRTALIVGTVAAGLLSVLPQDYWDRMSTMTSDKDDRDASVAGRLFFWGLAFQMANDHPLLGVGHTGFQKAYASYDPTDGQYGRERAVHSTWFGVLAEQGYVGLFMLVLVIVMALLACGRVRRQARGHPGKGETLFVYASAMQAALIAAVVGGTFLSYHYVEVLWHFLGLAFALEHVAANELAERTDPVITAPVRPPFAIPAPRAALGSGALARR
jgi:putative inorganic carbon (HCO3(-)) transporter